MIILRQILFGLLLAGALVNLQAADRKIRVTATTSMVADLVAQIGGERVTVVALMGPGVDPHLYKATASDVAKLQRADVVVYNGLLLEGKMDDLFGKLRSGKRKVFAVTAGLAQDKLLHPTDGSAHADPHVWFDVELWSQCIPGVVKGLTEADPKGKAYYEARGKEAQAKMAVLHTWAKQRTAEVPKEARVLITSHDAFSYFGRAYDFEVVGLQGISTVSEAGLADVAKLVDFIKSKKVRAIFVESSVSPAAINRISSDAGVKIGGELFSDAMGAAGQIENGYDLGTYDGMIRHNINSIVNALK